MKMTLVKESLLLNGKPLGYSSISPSRHIAIFFYQSFTAHCPVTGQYAVKH